MCNVWYILKISWKFGSVFFRKVANSGPKKHISQQVCKLNFYHLAKVTSSTIYDDEYLVFDLVLLGGKLFSYSVPSVWSSICLFVLVYILIHHLKNVINPEFHYRLCYDL